MKDLMKDLKQNQSSGCRYIKAGARSNVPHTAEGTGTQVPDAQEIATIGHSGCCGKKSAYSGYNKQMVMFFNCHI